MKELTDEQLMREIQGRNVEAFDVFFERYRRRVEGRAYMMLRNHEEAEEVLTDVFRNIWQKAHTFKFNAKVSSWVYRIMMNQVFMAMRKRRKQQRYLPHGSMSEVARLGEKLRPKLMIIEAPQFKDIQLSQAVKEIFACMETLPESNRDAAPFFEEPSHEAAAILDISIPAFKSKRHRARLHCRKRLANSWAVKSVLEEMS